MNIPQQKDEPQRTRRDTKEQIKLMWPNDTGSLEKAWGEKADLITAEILELRQIPLCSFVSFVVKRFSGGDLPSYAALCRSRAKNSRGKIASLFETSGYDPSEGAS